MSVAVFLVFFWFQSVCFWFRVGVSRCCLVVFWFRAHVFGSRLFFFGFFWFQTVFLGFFLVSVGRVWFFSGLGPIDPPDLF